MTRAPKTRGLNPDGTPVVPPPLSVTRALALKYATDNDPSTVSGHNAAENEMLSAPPEPYMTEGPSAAPGLPPATSPVLPPASPPGPPVPGASAGRNVGRFNRSARRSGPGDSPSVTPELLRRLAAQRLGLG